MSVAGVLERLGGVATRAELIQATSRAEVDVALRRGEIVAGRRGRYATADVDLAARVAHDMTGTLCLTSAAIHHGWEVKSVPARPQVAVPKNRKLRSAADPSVELHRIALNASELDGVATSVDKTLEMCLRALPFDEALCVADSALRHGAVIPSRLRGLALTARGPGSAQMRVVAASADGDAANPFESTLRAIALSVPGLRVKPQLVIRGRRVWARPDLVDEDLRIVVEADSFEWHGNRRGFEKDVRRYTGLTVEGWLVLRFTWEQVMFRPDEVRQMLVFAVELVVGRTEGLAPSRRAA